MSTLASSVDDDVLAVVVVTHNSADYIEACLASVVDSRIDAPLSVVVVDNRSDDETVERVRRSFPEVRVIVPATRGGFARNVNIGLQVAAGSRFLILNPDTRLEPTTLATVARYLDAHPEVGLAGCRLEDEHGRRETSFRSFPTLWRAFCELALLDRLCPRVPLFARRTMSHADPAREHRVDWLTGAFILARREVIDGDPAHHAAGYLDERFFLFVEDTEWCRRVRDAGWQIAYVPSARARHDKGSGHGWDLWRYTLTCQGTARYFLKHHGPLTAALYQAMLVPGLLARAGLAAFSLVLPDAPPAFDAEARGRPARRVPVRAERRRRLRGYLRLALRVMRGGLLGPEVCA